MASPACWEGRGFSTEVCEAMARAKVTAKRLRWLDHMFGEANLDPIRAAELCKFKRPHLTGPMIMRDLQEIVDLISREKNNLLLLEGNQILQGIGDIAVNGNNETNRLKAYELLAKIHGMLNEKLAISLDRRSLLKQLEILLPAPQPKQVGQGKAREAKVVKAEVVVSCPACVAGSERSDHSSSCYLS